MKQKLGLDCTKADKMRYTMGIYRDIKKPKWGIVLNYFQGYFYCENVPRIGSIHIHNTSQNKKNLSVGSFPLNFTDFKTRFVINRVSFVCRGERKFKLR